MSEYLITKPFVRCYRKIFRKCVVCGASMLSQDKKRYWYCSITCGCYDGTMSVRINRDLRNPSYFRGKTYKKRKPEKYDD